MKEVDEVKIMEVLQKKKGLKAQLNSGYRSP